MSQTRPPLLPVVPHSTSYKPETGRQYKLLDMHIYFFHAKGRAVQENVANNVLLLSKGRIQPLSACCICRLRHVWQQVQHAQVSFRLPPDAAVQVVAYDAASGAYAALQRPRPLVAAHATVVLPAPLALRAVSLRPCGTCLNQALPGLELGFGSITGAAAGAGSAPAPCEPCCERAGDIELTQPCEGGQGSAAGAPARQPCMGHAAEQAAWPTTFGKPAAPASAGAAAYGAAYAAAGAAEALPVSVPASTAAQRPTERAPTAAELWAGYQAAQVRSPPGASMLRSQLHRSRTVLRVASSDSCPSGAATGMVCMMPWQKHLAGSARPPRWPTWTWRACGCGPRAACCGSARPPAWLGG